MSAAGRHSAVCVLIEFLSVCEIWSPELSVVDGKHYFCATSHTFGPALGYLQPNHVKHTTTCHTQGLCWACVCVCVFVCVYVCVCVNANSEVFTTKPSQTHNIDHR